MPERRGEKKKISGELENILLHEGDEAIKQGARESMDEELIKRSNPRGVFRRALGKVLRRVK